MLVDIMMEIPNHFKKYSCDMGVFRQDDVFIILPHSVFDSLNPTNEIESIKKSVENKYNISVRFETVTYKEATPQDFDYYRIGDELHKFVDGQSYYVIEVNNEKLSFSENRNILLEIVSEMHNPFPELFANDGILKGFKLHIDLYCSQFVPKKDEEKNRSVDEVIYEIVKNAELAHGGYAFIQPASTYHRFMSGLTGGKMSSSIPESNIALSEDPKSAAKKIMKAKTGGRESADEQRELGGEFDKCSVYELYLFHLTDDDEELIQIQKECTSGSILCGECKKKAAGKMEAFLTDLQQKREEAFDKLPMFGIDYQRK